MSAATDAALRRLLWRSVADRDACSCVRAGLTEIVIDRCDLCEAWQALGYGRRWNWRRAAARLQDAPSYNRSTHG